LITLIKVIKNPAEFKSAEVNALADHREEILDYLRTFTRIADEHRQNLIDSVISFKRGNFLEDIFNPKDLSTGMLLQIADQLYEHVYTREREMQSADFMLKNLDAAIAEKQAMIVNHCQSQIGELKAMALHLAVANKKPVDRLEKLAADYMNLLNIFQKVQQQQPELALNIPISSQLKEIRSILARLPSQSAFMREAVKLGNQFELNEAHSAANKLFTAINGIVDLSPADRLELKPVRVLAQSIMASFKVQPRLIDLKNCQLFAHECIQVQKKYPALKWPLHNFIDQFPELVEIVQSVHRRSERIAKSAAHAQNPTGFLHHQRNEQSSSPSIGSRPG